MTEWLHPDDAPSRTSMIISAPWPDGQPYRGEGYRNSKGIWMWTNDHPVPRPVTAVCHLPIPPKEPPARNASLDTITCADEDADLHDPQDDDWLNEPIICDE